MRFWAFGVVIIQFEFWMQYCIQHYLHLNHGTFPVKCNFLAEYDWCYRLLPTWAILKSLADGIWHDDSDFLIVIRGTLSVLPNLKQKWFIILWRWWVVEIYHFNTTLTIANYALTRPSPAGLPVILTLRIPGRFPEGTSSRKTSSFEPSYVKILFELWPVGESTKQEGAAEKKKKQTRIWNCIFHPHGEPLQ